MESKESRINSMRAAISETFPEPNRRLLQRLVFFLLMGKYFVSELAFNMLNNTFTS